MNTPKTTPDFGEPWVLQNEGNNLWVALRDESEVIDDIVCDAPSHEYVASASHWPDRASRIVSCVNACAGMSDPAAEIQASRDAVKEACDALEWAIKNMNPPFEWEPFTKANATLSKLQSLA